MSAAFLFEIYLLLLACKAAYFYRADKQLGFLIHKKVDKKHGLGFLNID